VRTGWMLAVAAPALLVAPLAAQAVPDSASAPDSAPAVVRHDPRSRLEADFASGPVAGWRMGYTHVALHARMLLPVGREGSAGLEVGRAVDLALGEPRVQDILALLRLPAAPDVSVETGLGMYWAGALGSHPGFHAGVLWHQPFTGRLEVPIGVRVDAVFSQPMIMPITVTFGVGWRLHRT
jgi:hypothetical protein